MKIVEKKPARDFWVGLDKSVKISDCAQVYLQSDEQVTFVTPEGKEHDFCAKSWGFYATPSVNSRLKNAGFKTALVQNSKKQCYIMVVDKDKLDDFNAYLQSDQNHVVQWLDEIPSA